MDEDMSSPTFRSYRTTFKSALSKFASSQNQFQIVRSVPQDRTSSDTKTVYVLDSSFNPPSKAHAALATNALFKDGGSQPMRLLLLLATENADKKPKPAVFEDRLAMMTLMAQDLQRSISSPAFVIDIGVTKKPFFVDKAKSIEESTVYGTAEQVHLTGFDTIIRIFDSKYYPADQKLRVLAPFLDAHRLRVTYRLGDKFGTKADQDLYIQHIADGSRADEGMQSEWSKKIDMVDDAKDSVGVSSTEAREACKEGRIQDLDRYVCKEVKQYIQGQGLYQ